MFQTPSALWLHTFQKITIRFYTYTDAITGQSVESYTEKETMGLIQAARPEKLTVSDMGKRSRKKWDLFLQKDEEVLSIQDSIIDSTGKVFQVSEILDWRWGSFAHYQMIEKDV